MGLFLQTIFTKDVFINLDVDMLHKGNRSACF